MQIIVENFQKKIRINAKRIKQIILQVLSKENVKKSGEITVCFVNNKVIQGLNLKYRHKNNPTDVLVFDITEPKNSKYIFADIVISTDVAIHNAVKFKTSVLYELYLYVVHGTLHLLGYSDKTARQRKIMDKKASDILNLDPQCQ